MYETAVPEQTTITDDELKRMLHPMEKSRLTLALVGLAPIALLTLILMVVTAGALFITVGFVLAAVWVAMRMHEARLRGQAVEVSGEHFPELKAVLDDVCHRLGYTKEVSMYIVNAGDVDATVLRLFGKRILWVNSGLVEAMDHPDSRAELEFVMGRFVGALKARHLRFGELAAVISGFTNLVGINLLILPYLRATVLSGDQMGMMISGDAVASVRAMNKLFIGKGLSDRVSLSATTAQALRHRSSAFRWLSIALTSQPHMTDRLLNLVAFSQSPVAASRLSGASDPALLAAAELIPTYRTL